MLKPKRIDAIASLSPKTGFSSDNNGNVIDWDIGSTKSGLSQPTEEAIQTKLATMISDWEAQEYARNRASEYPSLLELTVALYDTDDKSAVEAKRASVKLKYPKP